MIGLAFFLNSVPILEAKEPLSASRMSQVTARAGVDLYANLQFEETGSSNALVIEDNGGFPDLSGAFEYLVVGDIIGDVTIDQWVLDTYRTTQTSPSLTAFQISMDSGDSFMGDLSLNDIRVSPSSSSSSGSTIGSLTLEGPFPTSGKLRIWGQDPANLP